METKNCTKCDKVIEGYNSNQVEHLMQQHMLKHERENNLKIQIEKEKIVVYAYVCADPFHIGHLIHLQNSKALGDKLIVGVLTDEAVMERKQKPVYSFKERIEIIRAIKCVDEVIPQTTYSPLPNALKLKPNILSESTSHKPEDIKEAEKIMAGIGGKVKVMPYYDGQSSTAIKEKIKTQWTKQN